MVNTRSQYGPDDIRAAKRVLLELARVFADDLDHIVFVGGMACGLLFPQQTNPHEGTIDVDVAVDPVALAEYGDETYEERLIYANYQQVEGKIYRWDRRFRMGDYPASVMVDFLSGEFEGSPSTRTRAVQGLHASVLHGMNLAFLSPNLIPVSGELPDGTSYRAVVRVCSAASLLAMKGISVRDRLSGADKDAVDIDYILRGYPGGYAALARVFKTDYYAHHDLVQEGLQGVAWAFRSLDAIGPASVATPDRLPDDDERAIARQGAFLRARRFLAEVGVE